MGKQGSKKSKKPTQADVARRAGVSQATVSYVLNDASDTSVPIVTRERILLAVEELGYIPNGTARSLRTKKTYTIASAIPDITNPFYPDFERGVQRVAERHGYDLIVYNTNGELEKERKVLHLAQQGRVDGVIVVFFHLRARDLGELLDRDIAVVRLEVKKKIGSKFELPLDSICVDNAAAARTVVNHLIERNHSRIGMLAGRRGPREQREIGYRQALETHGLAIDEEMIREGDFTEEGGYYAMRELLESGSRPTAIFAANDVMALGAFLAIRESGFRIPEDIALAGFDDTPASRLVSPPLTTITQFQDQLGRRTAELLFDRLNGSAPERGRYEEMPFELLVRDST